MKGRFVVKALIAPVIVTAIVLVQLLAPFGEAARNLLVAYVAQAHAGDPISYDPLYMNAVYYKDYGMLTNSKWLTNNVRLIVPYLQYEGVTPLGIYPEAIAFQPLLGTRSLHIIGMAYVEPRVVVMNERWLIDEVRNDERAAFSALVHELIHLQGGNYHGGDSEALESATQAATLETLAAMCNYGDDLACKSFWYEFKGYALSSAKLDFHRLGQDRLFNVIHRVFFPSRNGDVSYRKAMRFWASNPNEYWYIVRAYSVKPYEIVRAGVNGTPMATGHRKIVQLTSFSYTYGGETHLQFDDTRDLLGWLTNLIK